LLNKIFNNNQNYSVDNFNIKSNSKIDRDFIYKPRIQAVV